MKRRFEDYLEERLSDPEFDEEYRKLDLAFQVATQVINLRQMLEITQAELAKRANTKQSAISRLENATSTPSLSFLLRVAEALNARVEVRLVQEGTDLSKNGSAVNGRSPEKL